MSHVDEGALHAYLDGALDEYPQAEASRIREHLDQCAECAERLEVEREVRSDAHAVLALAAPDVDLPSLEELRAYVTRTRPKRSVASTRMVRMGWAASVALALGTGYILRDGQLAMQSPSLQMDATPAAEAVDGPARDALESDGAEADDAASFNVAAEAPSRASEGEGATPEGEAQGVVGQRLVAEQESLPAPGGASADVLSGGGAGRLERAAPAEVAVNRVANEPPVVPPPVATSGIERFNDSVETVASSADVLEEVLDDRTSIPADVLPAPADLMDSLRQVVPGAPVNALADAGQTVGAASDSAADPAAEPAVDEDSARRRSDSPVAVTSALETTASGGFAAKADDPELETLPATAVPGLELIQVSAIGEGTIFLGTHTTQRLDGGGVLSVFHLEPEVSPSVLPARNAAEEEVTLETEEGWIVLRGPRSEAELQGLLERLLPEG